MNLKEIDDLMITRYYNPTHGLELTPDINNGYRGNENGIVYFASYLFMKDIIDYRSESHSDLFNTVEQNCIELREGVQIKGLHNRGAFESHLAPKVKRSISHDNISAFSSISKYFGSFASTAAKDIYKYGLKHFFIYNNRKVLFDLPMNPGNWSVWAFNGGSKLLWLLMLPFFLINMKISLNKPPEDTSSKILYFIELYPNRNKPVWKNLWQIYKKKMEEQYGKKWLNELMKIYFLPNHPNVLISELIEEV